jgi:hypothetical protein
MRRRPCPPVTVLFLKDITMRFTFAAFAVTAPLLMSACSNVAPANSGTPSTPAAARCNAVPAQFAVGRNIDAAVESDARARAGARTSRVLRPNQVVTMEFNAERLNLTVDDAGRVTRVSCG